MNSAIAMIIVAIFIVASVFLLLIHRRQSGRKQSLFEREYDRISDKAGDRRNPDAGFAGCENRVDKLDLRPLDRPTRDRFVARWAQVQSDFADDPKRAIREADRLIGEVMKARGYPVENFDQAAADISLDHPSVVQRYRAAHGIVVRHARGEGETEDLREAMINFRPLFDELVSSGDGGEHDPRRIKNDRRTRARGR